MYAWIISRYLCLNLSLIVIWVTTSIQHIFVFVLHIESVRNCRNNPGFQFEDTKKEADMAPSLFFNIKTAKKYNKLCFINPTFTISTPSRRKIKLNSQYKPQQRHRPWLHTLTLQTDGTKQQTVISEQTDSRDGAAWARDAKSSVFHL